MLTGYQKNAVCQDVYEPFTGVPVPITDLAGDVIVLANRASTPAQESSHDAKLDFMQSTLGNVGTKVLKKAFTGSGRLKPLYDYNESHGLDFGYKGTWFGDLENALDEVLGQSFPGQRVTVLFLTPDRLARPQKFHPHNPHTWGLTSTDGTQFDQWMTTRFGNRRRYVRFLTFFAGSPGQCRGLQSKIGMQYTGNRGGRPKGSKNKKPRISLTPKQKTALRKVLRAEIPYLVKELKLNGTECYHYLKGHYPVVPVIRRTVQKWVAEERGTPGTSGRPARKPIPPEPKNKCALLQCRHNRPIGKHPVLVRVKRLRSIDRPPPPKRVNKFLFFPYSRIRPRPP